MNFLKSMPKEKLQKVILVAIGTLAALGVIGNFFIAKQLTEMSQQGARAEKLQTEIKDLETKLKAEADSETLREELKAFVAAQQQRMVSGDSFSWVVREMNLLAEKHPVKEFNVQPGAKVTGPKKIDLYVTHLSLTATYDEIGKFIADFENQFPLSQIRNLTVMSVGETRACHADFEVALMIKPPEPVAKAEPAKAPKNVDAKKVEGKKA